jgi:hypothetical protein
MSTSPVQTLTRVTMLTACLMFSPSALRAADVEGIIGFGDSSSAPSSFSNPQPSDALVELATGSYAAASWGDNLQALLSFSGPGGTVTDEGTLFAVDFHEPLRLGRLALSAGITSGRELSALDLDIPVTLTKPAGNPGQPAVLRIPLIIETIRRDVSGTLYGTGGRVIFPMSFPEAVFKREGRDYVLKIIGFGTLDDKGNVTTVPSLDLIPVNTFPPSPIVFSDLFGKIEPRCPHYPGRPQQITWQQPCGGPDGPTGKLAVQWGSYGPGPRLESNGGETLDVECVQAGVSYYGLYYTPSPGGTRRLVGKCPFLGGCNSAWFSDAGDSNPKDGKPDCFVLTRWISKDYGKNDRPNACSGSDDEDEKSSPKLDWCESIFAVDRNELTKIDRKFEYAVGPPVVCGAAAEGKELSASIVDPQVGPETDLYFDQAQHVLESIPPPHEPMEADPVSPGDLNRDGKVDTADLSTFQDALGSCIGQSNYNLSADFDANGCVTIDDYQIWLGFLAPSTPSCSPPAITDAVASPDRLWPPNHRMVDVTVKYTVTSDCAATCTLDVVSNEPSEGDGSPNWVVVDANHVQLLAERAGAGTGRVYTTTVACTNSEGQASSTAVTVIVPHDQRRTD